MATFGVIHRKRFHPQDDVHLMREVLSLNPFTDSSKWAVVAQGVNAASEKEFTVRGCRERIDLLLNLFRKQDWNNLRKSGSEAQYKEKTALLQEVSDLEIECGGPRTRIASSTRKPMVQPKPKDTSTPIRVAVVADTSEQDSTLLCQVYEEGLDASPQPSYAYSDHEEAPITGDVEVVLTPDASQWSPRQDNGKRKADNANADDKEAAKKRPSDNFIREKELELEERRLRLEEERLALEKTKFEADREYEMRKLQMEEEDRKSRRESERLQAELMRKMFDQLVKKLA
ncbi:uncharacterized protein LOC135368255 isoform X1 [Ornithodoros turicata]|uniref:uncharacterized protein LOC135368255 isoform X1 n=1 Tax=Ornithodoros turicata TaxID=34597 RepID=UPI00313A2B03